MSMSGGAIFNKFLFPQSLAEPKWRPQCLPAAVLVTKCRVWLPDDWVYSSSWRDRPINWITSRREACHALGSRLSPGARYPKGDRSTAPLTAPGVLEGPSRHSPER